MILQALILSGGLAFAFALGSLFGPGLGNEIAAGLLGGLAILAALRYVQ